MLASAKPALRATGRACVQSPRILLTPGRSATISTGRSGVAGPRNRPRRARARSAPPTPAPAPQGQCHVGPARGAHAHHRPAHCGRHLLHLLQHQPGLEVCEWRGLGCRCCCVHAHGPGLCRFCALDALNPLWPPPQTRAQEQAFEEAQKYKEGKFIIEKARVMKVRLPGHGAGASAAAASQCIAWPRCCVRRVHQPPASAGLP